MDELLLRRAAAGEPEAVERLLGGVEALVWRVCWHYTGDRESASDCGQETMIRIWRSLGSFRFDCAFESWAYRIAANCCLDYLRKKKRENAASLEPLREQDFDPPDPSPGPEAEALRRDGHARLREAIAGLPEEQRDALVLTQLEGLSYEKAAGLLGVSEGTVKSRVNRARNRLKEIFSEEGNLSGASPVQRRERRNRS